MEATKSLETERSNDPRKTKIVYTVTERSGKSFWTRVGVGSLNRDGSINLRLDAIPVSGTLQVRDWEPREDREGGTRDGARGPGLARGERREPRLDKTADLPF